jgi:hypothetical protein
MRGKTGRAARSGRKPIKKEQAMVIKANKPEEVHATMQEEMTDAPGEQPLTGSAEEARRSTRAPQDTDVPGEQQRSTGRKSRRGILRKWLVTAAAAVGAGALFKANTATAYADGVEGPTSFQSNDGRHGPLVAAAYNPKTVSEPDETIAIECSGSCSLLAYTLDVTSPFTYPVHDVYTAVVATSPGGYGLYASAGSGYPAVYGTNSNGTGVEGAGATGVQAVGSSVGVQASSANGSGVYASSVTGAGVIATSNGPAAILALGEAGIGVHAAGANAAAAASPVQAGVFAQGGPSYYGVYATNTGGTAVYGRDSANGWGVIGASNSGIGVFAASNSGHALIVNGLMKVEGYPVGQATIPAGSSSVMVSSPAATSISNVLLTPLGNPNGSLWVTRANGSFTINASAAQSSSLSIVYLIIN